MGKDVQLNVYNFAAMRAQPPEQFEFIRLDPNNDCNVQCVYCHNHRTADRLDAVEIRQYLDENVLSAANVQVGCIMEPTLDERLADLLELIAKSRARPQRHLVLQTNGLLLNRHDAGRLRDAGLTLLAISMDSMDQRLHRELRGGSSVSKVAGNLRRFHAECPAVEMMFVTTVTRANLDGLPDLVRFGRDLGVSRFVFREVFYHPDSDVVDHARMPELVLKPGEFEAARDRLRSLFGGGLRSLFRGVRLEFSSRTELDRHDRQTRIDSLRL